MVDNKLRSIDVYILIFIYVDYVKNWCCINHFFWGNFKSVFVIFHHHGKAAFDFPITLCLLCIFFPPFFKAGNQSILTTISCKGKKAWFHRIRHHFCWNFVLRFDYPLHYKPLGTGFMFRAAVYLCFALSNQSSYCCWFSLWIVYSKTHPLLARSWCSHQA